MKKILLWDRRFPASIPLRLTVDDAVAGALVRAGVAAAEDPAEQGSLNTGDPLSGDYPVEIALTHGFNAERVAHVTVPLAVAQIAEAAGLGSRLPIAPIAAPDALVTADTSDFIISPIDGQQLTGA